jgi:cytidylate kinase
MAHRVVCISRVTAAGGEAIGQLAAARLGFRYVDDEVISVAAEAARIDPKILKSTEQHESLLARMMDSLFSRAGEPKSYFERATRADYANDVKTTAPPAEELRQLIQDGIVEIARRGQVVIVAHAASMALAGRADVLRVNVVASVATRIRRLSSASKLLNEAGYADAISESDYQRRKYLARFYDIQEELPTHYDLLINTDVLAVEQAVAAICAAATSQAADSSVRS